MAKRKPRPKAEVTAQLLTQPFVKGDRVKHPTDGVPSPLGVGTVTEVHFDKEWVVAVKWQSLPGSYYYFADSLELAP